MRKAIKTTIIVPQIKPSAEMELILKYGGWKACPQCKQPYFTVGDLMQLCEECADKELIAQLDAGEYDPEGSTNAPT